MLNPKGWRQLSRGDPDPGAVGSNPRLNGRYLSAWHKRLVRALCIVLASSDALAAKSVPVCGPAAGVTTATKPTASAMLCGDSFLSWSEREHLDMDLQGRRGDRIMLSAVTAATTA